MNKTSILVVTPFLIYYQSISDFFMIAKLQALKKSASKGDKKKKKEVTEEITRLEAETAARHENEILEFQTKVVFVEYF